jgi:hypothetical protein
MLYYKIIEDSQIVDVNTDFDIKYVNYIGRCDSFMICQNNENPIGVISSDGGKIYHIMGYAEIPNESSASYSTVTVEEIDKEEYEALKKALDENKIITEPEPEPVAPVEEPKTQEEIEAEQAYLQSLQFVKDSKIQYMSYVCQQTIYDGCDVEMDDNTLRHFSFTDHDQKLIQGLYLKVQLGETEDLHYHADNYPCQYFSAEEIVKLYKAMEELIDWHTTYFNSLKHYILSLDSMESISSIEYGIEIPEEYQSEVLKDMITKYSE